MIGIIGRAVELQWLTNTIDNSKDFIIERSTDGQTFEPLKSIHDFANKNKDAFFKELDKQPLIGTNYYRLKQVLTDGQLIFSPIQAVNFQVNLDKLVIFPNPAQALLNVQLPELVGQAVTIQLFDAFGQFQQNVAIESISTDLIQIPLTDFPNGLYYLQIAVGHQKPINRKVIINRLN